MAAEPVSPCPTDILVDLGTENKEAEVQVEKKPVTSPETHTEVPKTPPDKPKTSPEHKNKSPKPDVPEKLCGYLLKVNQGGLMKGSKNRWFVFEKENCTLTYYRSPKDISGNRLGSIPISNCAFTCTAEGLLVNSFQITIDSRSHILQACDQKTMLWWLQELQTERRIYNTRHHHHSHIQKQFGDDGQKKSYALDPHPTEAGLLKKTVPSDAMGVQEISRDSLSVIPVLPRIENPPDTVGIKSANLAKQRSTSGIGGGLSEIGNKVTQLGGGITKMRLKPARPAPPVGASVFYAKKQANPADDNLTIGPALRAKGSESKHKNPLSRTTAGVSHLLDKIQNAVKTGGKTHGDSKHLEEINETLTLVREEMELMKTSLESKEETIQLLKKELDKYSTISTYNSANAGSATDDDTAQTFSGASTNHQMRSEITALKLTIEHLREEVDETKLLLKQQKEKTTLFQEMLQVKDGIVVQLTNELYEMERSYKSVLSEYEGFKGKSKEEFVVVSAVPPEGENAPESQNRNDLNLQELKKLQDEVEGYKLQNKFLNNEILELTHMRKTDQEKMNSFHDKILHQEALHCQLQSKYFILLAEMDRTRSQTVVYAEGDNPLLAQPGRSGPNVVKQLIQEAIKEGETRAAEISASFKSTKYDQYGFTQIVDDGDESTFLSAASRLEQHASSIVNSIEQHDASVALKWQKYVSENKEWQRNAEFKALVRLGVPHDLRHRVWRHLVHIRTHEIRQMLNSDGKYYTRLTETAAAPLHAKQIDLDLLRTLPSNRFFATMDCVGTQQLKRVLGAYSLHNPTIGYCQGLNRIAAVALLYLGEEDAFWGLVAIVECIMPPEYYSPTLTASQADQRVFRDLLAEKMPRLHRHLETLGVDISLISFNWFLCMYCDNVPPETMFKIWDVFLNESSKVLFRYGLAFFKHIEDDILELSDYMTLFNLLRRMVHRMYDSRVLSQIAFQGMNPFPMRKVHRLRAVYLEKVRAELHQLDVLRNEFASRRNKTANSDMYSDDEEGDST